MKLLLLCFLISSSLLGCVKNQKLDNMVLSNNSLDPLTDDQFDAVYYVVSPTGDRCIVTATDNYKAISSGNCLSKSSNWTAIWKGQKIKVKEVRLHPDYKKSKLDLGVILLDTPINAKWYVSGYQWFYLFKDGGLAVVIDKEGKRKTAELKFKEYRQLGTRKNSGLVFVAGPKNQILTSDMEGAPVFTRGELAGILKEFNGAMMIFTSGKLIEPLRENFSSLGGLDVSKENRKSLQN